MSEENTTDIPELQGFELDDIFSTYHYAKVKEVFELVENEIESYDEGMVTETFVVKHKPSGKFFSASSASNSWDDYYDGITDVQEVFPEERTITVYVARKTDDN